MLSLIVISLLVVPPLVLLTVQLQRFLVVWFRGYRVRDVGDRPLTKRFSGRAAEPRKVCPGCGRMIAAEVGECPHCLLRFDPAARHQLT